MTPAVASTNALDVSPTPVRRWLNQTIYALAAAGSACLLTMVFSNLVDGGAATEALIRRQYESPLFWLEALAALTIGPVVETALMAWLIHLALDRKLNRFLVILMSACLWAALHRIGTNGSGWAAFFPFIAFSFAYVERQRSPMADGFVVATMAHIFYNAAASCLMIFNGLFRT